MTTHRKQLGPAIAILALLPGMLIGALVLILTYPLVAFAGWAMKEDVK